MNQRLPMIGKYIMSLAISIAVSLALLSSCSSAEGDIQEEKSRADGDIIGNTSEDTNQLGAADCDDIEIEGQEISPLQTPILILNGTLEEGKAAVFAEELDAAGYVNVEVGNTGELTESETRITYRDKENEFIANEFADICGIENRRLNVMYAPDDHSWPDEYGLLIVLGVD